MPRQRRRQASTSNRPPLPPPEPAPTGGRGMTSASCAAAVFGFPVGEVRRGSRRSAGADRHSAFRVRPARSGASIEPSEDDRGAARRRGTASLPVGRGSAFSPTVHVSSGRRALPHDGWTVARHDTGRGRWVCGTASTGPRAACSSLLAGHVERQPDDLGRLALDHALDRGLVSRPGRRSGRSSRAGPRRRIGDREADPAIADVKAEDPGHGAPGPRPRRGWFPSGWRGCARPNGPRRADVADGRSDPAGAPEAPGY